MLILCLWNGEKVGDPPSPSQESGKEAPRFQAGEELPAGGNALIENPLRGSHFVSERLETPLLGLHLGGNVGLDKLIQRFDVQHTGFTRYTCLMLHRRARGWPCTPWYLFRQ